MDETWTRLEVLEIEERKHYVCAHKVDEKKEDDGNTGSNFVCKRYVKESGKDMCISSGWSWIWTVVSCP